MKEIALLDSGIFFGLNTYKSDVYQGKFRIINLYDLPNIDLSLYKALIIPMHVDEEYLFRYRLMIEKYLDQSGIVCSFAQNFLPWLPGNSLWQRSTLPIKNREIYPLMQHPITAGVEVHDLNYRKGVKGFFSRGYFHEPDGADVLLVDNLGETVLYLDRKTTNGTILAGAGADLISYSIRSGATSDQLGPQLLDWIESEAEFLKGGAYENEISYPV